MVYKEATAEASWRALALDQAQGIRKGTAVKYSQTTYERVPFVLLLSYVYDADISGNNYDLAA